LVRMDDKNDFIMTHLTLLKGKATWASSKSDGVEFGNQCSKGENKL